MPMKRRQSRQPASRRKPKYRSVQMTAGRPLGITKKTTHRYTAIGIPLTASSSLIAGSHIFSANGMFDPDVTGVGQQPIGFDQLASMFDHYTVIYSTIRVLFNSTDTTDEQIVGIQLTDSPGSVSSAVRIIENGSGPSQLMQQRFTSGGTKTLTSAANISTFLGRPSIMSEDDLRGSSSANPAEQAYFRLWNAGTNTAGTPTCDCTVIIDYTVVWSEPTILLRS